jgi:hypothetical protein
MAVPQTMTHWVCIAVHQDTQDQLAQSMEEINAEREHAEAQHPKAVAARKRSDERANKQQKKARRADRKARRKAKKTRMKVKYLDARQAAINKTDVSSSVPSSTSVSSTMSG